MPDNTSMDELRERTPDLRVTGNPDDWELVCKASSTFEGWSKSTKRMKVPGGWLYQVTTEHRRGDYSTDPEERGPIVACAEALAFVPEAEHAR